MRDTTFPHERVEPSMFSSMADERVHRKVCAEAMHDGRLQLLAFRQQALIIHTKSVPRLQQYPFTVLILRTMHSSIVGILHSARWELKYINWMESLYT